jgi:hypothetical protein
MSLLTSSLLTPTPFGLRDLRCHLAARRFQIADAFLRRGLGLALELLRVLLGQLAIVNHPLVFGIEAVLSR